MESPDGRMLFIAYRTHAPSPVEGAQKLCVN